MYEISFFNPNGEFQCFRNQPCGYPGSQNSGKMALCKPGNNSSIFSIFWRSEPFLCLACKIIFKEKWWENRISPKYQLRSGTLDSKMSSGKQQFHQNENLTKMSFGTEARFHAKPDSRPCRETEQRYQRLLKMPKNTILKFRNNVFLMFLMQQRTQNVQEINRLKQDANIFSRKLNFRISKF